MSGKLTREEAKVIVDAVTATADKAVQWLLELDKARGRVAELETVLRQAGEDARAIGVLIGSGNHKGASTLASTIRTSATDTLAAGPSGEQQPKQGHE